jgi:hypothetical protein
VRAAVDSRQPKRLGLLLAQCASPAEPRRPAIERLREKIGAQLERVLVFALAGNQRRSARRGWRLGSSEPKASTSRYTRKAVTAPKMNVVAPLKPTATPPSQT